MIVYAVVDDSLSHTFPLADAIETMDLLFRESDVDGEESSYALLPDKRDEFVLALFRGAPRPGTVSEICVGLAADEIETVRAGLQVEAITPEHGKHWLRLTIRWASAGRCRSPHRVQEQRRDRRAWARHLTWPVPAAEASSEHTNRQSVNSPSRLNTTNARTSKTFSSTMAAAAIKRYIHQSTHDTSSRLVGFPLRDVLGRTRAALARSGAPGRHNIAGRPCGKARPDARAPRRYSSHRRPA